MSATQTRAASIAIIFVAAFGCATFGSSTACPAKGGPPWTEITTRHFVIRTDLDADDADELARQLEEARAVLLAAAWPKAPDPSESISVLSFRNAGELLEFAPDGVAGEMRHAPPFPPLIVLKGIGVFTGSSPVEHELQHELGRRFLPLQPPWFSEGVASFFETLSYDRKAATAKIGYPSDMRLAALGNLGRLSAAEVIPGTLDFTDTRQIARFEATSWAVFHYLIDEHPNELDRYQALIGNFTPAAEAWSLAFPDLPFDRLDAKVFAYVRDGRYRGGQMKISIDVGAIRRRPMTDAEVHGLRAFLYATAEVPDAETRQRTREEADEALAQDPNELEALAVESYFLKPTNDERLGLARRAQNNDASRSLAAAMIADAAGPARPESRAALLHALASSPDDREVVLRLSLAEASVGRWEQALAFSARAIRLGAAYDSRLLLVHARALAHAGKCEDAVAFSAALAAYRPDAARASLETEVARICAAATPAQKTAPP